MSGYRITRMGRTRLDPIDASGRVSQRLGGRRPRRTPHAYGNYSDEERAWIVACDAERRRLGVASLDPAQLVALAVRLGYRRANP